MCRCNDTQYQRQTARLTVAWVIPFGRCEMKHNRRHSVLLHNILRLLLVLALLHVPVQ